MHPVDKTRSEINKLDLELKQIQEDCLHKYVTVYSIERSNNESIKSITYECNYCGKLFDREAL